MRQYSPKTINPEALKDPFNCRSIILIPSFLNLLDLTVDAMLGNVDTDENAEKTVGIVEDVFSVLNRTDPLSEQEIECIRAIANGILEATKGEAK